MARGAFEEIVGSKFKNSEIKPSAKVWEGIQGSLDVHLLKSYSRQNVFYKKLAVAAVLLAFLSLGVQVLVYSVDEFNQNTFSNSFNALIEGDFYQTSSFSKQRSNDLNAELHRAKFIWLKESENYNRASKDDSYLSQASAIPNHTQGSEKQEVNLLHPRNPKLDVASVNWDINTYQKPHLYLLGRDKNKTETKLWAGLSAGAGTYDSDFSNGPLAVNYSSLINNRPQLNAPSASASQYSVEDGTSISLGFDLGLKLSQRWSVESGIAYANLSNGGNAELNVLDILSVDNQELVDINSSKLSSRPQTQQPQSLTETEVEVGDSRDDLSVINSFQLASVPLKAGYFLIDKKFVLKLNAGLAANYILGNQVSDPSDIIDGMTDGTFNDWFFDGIGGVEMGYSISDRFNFTIEPNYRQSITPLSSSFASTSGFNLRTGIRYYIK